MGKLAFYNIEPAPGSCPWARRAWIALEEKKLEYEVKLVDKANKPAEFNQLYHSIWTDEEATTKVPIVVDTDGSKVTESSIVVEYLDARYPEHGTRLVPADAAKAAKARLLAELFGPNFIKRYVVWMGATDAEELDQAKEAFGKGLAVLDRYLKANGSNAQPWLLEEYSIAEVLCAPFVHNTAVTLPEFKHISLLDLAKEQGLERVAAWMQGILDRPSTAATAMPDAEVIKAAEGRVQRANV